MMGEVILLLQAVDYAIKLLKSREARSAKELEARNAFLESFRDAIVLTRAYIADRRDQSGKRSRTRELKLSRAWNRVGIRAKSIPGGAELAQMYFAKSDYWSDPKRWALSELASLDISLEKAEFEATKLMTDK